MITQKFMGGGSLYPLGYVYLDLGNKKTIDQAVSGGYITIENGSSNSVNFTVKKDCFLVESSLSNIKVSGSSSSFNTFHEIALKSGQNFTLSATYTFNVNHCKSNMNIIPYRTDSKKIYVDYSTGTSPTKTAIFDSAVSAGYISNQGSAGTDKTGLTIYKIKFLKNCHLCTGNIFFGGIAEKNRYGGFFPVQKNTILNMSNYFAICPLLSSSFVPNIDYSILYEFKQGVNLGFFKFEDHTYKETDGRTITIGKVTLNRDILFIYYKQYSSMGSLDDVANPFIHFLPLKSGTVFYIGPDTSYLDYSDDISWGVPFFLYK